MISSSQLQCRNDIVCTRVFGDYCIRGNSHQAYYQKLMPRLFTLPVHDIRNSTHSSSEDGWLLSTPNPDCSQSTAEHRRTSSSLIHQGYVRMSYRMFSRISTECYVHLSVSVLLCSRAFLYHRRFSRPVQPHVGILR